MNNQDAVDTNVETIKEIVTGLTEVARRFEIIARSLPDDAQLHEGNALVQTMYEVDACYKAAMRALGATEGKSVTRRPARSGALQAGRSGRWRR